MHSQQTEPRLFLAILAVIFICCTSITTQTPSTLVMLAIGMVIIGILGWANSQYLPSTWLVRLGAAILVLLGAAFLIWYFFYGGRALLHPIFDPQIYFKHYFESQ
jgi:Na+/citrate or Na+/malate symporter